MEGPKPRIGHQQLPYWSPEAQYCSPKAPYWSIQAPYWTLQTPYCSQQTDSTLVPRALLNTQRTGPSRPPTGPYKTTYWSSTSPILVPICPILVPTGPIVDPLCLILVICRPHISPSRLHKGPFRPRV